MKVYNVIVYRYGDKEKHSYIVGTTSTLEMAIELLEKEEIDRGGKYAGVVHERELDKNTNPKIVYQSGALLEFQRQRKENIFKILKEYDLFSAEQEFISDLKSVINKEYNFTSKYIEDNMANKENIEKFNSFKDSLRQRLNTIINNEFHRIKAERALTKLKIKEVENVRKANDN
jgi:hypothetical protein